MYPNRRPQFPVSELRVYGGALNIASRCCSSLPLTASRTSARVALMCADPERDDLKLPVKIHDLVKYLRQYKRINYMAFQFNFSNCSHRNRFHRAERVHAPLKHSMCPKITSITYTMGPLSTKTPRYLLTVVYLLIIVPMPSSVNNSSRSE